MGRRLFAGTVLLAAGVHFSGEPHSAGFYPGPLGEAGPASDSAR